MKNSNTDSQVTSAGTTKMQIEYGCSKRGRHSIKEQNRTKELCTMTEWSGQDRMAWIYDC